MSRIGSLVAALRPSQWVKNLLVFTALIFAGRAGDSTAVVETIIAFLIFCAAASGIYLLNDIRDREADRQHPLKQNRPIASGALPVPVAGMTATLLILAALLDVPRLAIEILDPD